MIIELKCTACDTGLFKVETIAGLGKLPLKITCHICGRQYIVKLDENGSPAVFYRNWRKLEIAGLEPIESAPGPEVTPEGPAEEPSEQPAVGEWEAEPGEPAEAPTEEPPEQVAAEEPAPGSEVTPEPEPGTGEPAEEVE